MASTRTLVGWADSHKSTLCVDFRSRDSWRCPRYSVYETVLVPTCCGLVRCFGEPFRVNEQLHLLAAFGDELTYSGGPSQSRPLSHHW